MAIKFGQKLRQLIGTVAPTLGTALGGPLGGIAGKMVQDALGVDSEDAAIKMLESDPDALLKIKESERAFETRMEELGIDLERVHQMDRDSARQRQVATSDKTPQILAYVYTLGFFSVMGIQFFIVIQGVQVDPNALRLLDTSMGILFAMMIASKDFFFGSSSGSKAKTELLSSNK